MTRPAGNGYFSEVNPTDGYEARVASGARWITERTTTISREMRISQERALLLARRCDEGWTK